MSNEDFTALRNVLLIPCIIALQVFLWVVLCREWIKRDLRERACEPLRVRWRPFAWRTNKVTCSFRVDYSDLSGRIHRAICWTYWHRRSVIWGDDRVIGYSSQSRLTR
jgi:hypothetical protein